MPITPIIILNYISRPQAYRGCSASTSAPRALALARALVRARAQVLVLVRAPSPQSAQSPPTPKLPLTPLLTPSALQQGGRVQARPPAWLLLLAPSTKPALQRLCAQSLHAPAD